MHLSPGNERNGIREQLDCLITNAVAQAPEATVAQRALYAFVQRKVKEPMRPFERDKYPMPSGWREFVKNGEAQIQAYAQAEGADREQ